MLHAHTHYYAAALGGKVTVLQSLVITPTLHLKSKIDKNTRDHRDIEKSHTTPGWIILTSSLVAMNAVSRLHHKKKMYKMAD